MFLVLKRFAEPTPEFYRMNLEVTLYIEQITRLSRRPSNSKTNTGPIFKQGQDKMSPPKIQSDWHLPQIHLIDVAAWVGLNLIEPKDPFIISFFFFFFVKNGVLRHSLVLSQAVELFIKINSAYSRNSVTCRNRLLYTIRPIIPVPHFSNSKLYGIFW